MGFSKKLEIYSVCSIVYMIVLVFGGILLQIFDSFFLRPKTLFKITIIIYYIVSLWFVAVVYKDAKRRGLSRNWCFLIFFLLIFGAIIYYVHVKEKSKIETEEKITGEEVKKLLVECPECGEALYEKELYCPICKMEFPDKQTETLENKNIDPTEEIEDSNTMSIDDIIDELDIRKELIKTLKDAGYHHITDFKEMDTESLIKIEGISPTVARKILSFVNSK